MEKDLSIIDINGTVIGIDDLLDGSGTQTNNLKFYISDDM